jgi:lipoprotein NlpI/transglutaminase-like putative cysteine protease
MKAIAVSTFLIVQMAALTCFAADRKAPQAKSPATDARARAATVPGKGYVVQPAPEWVERVADVPEGVNVDRTSMHYRMIDDQIRVQGDSEESYSRVVRIVDAAAGLEAASQIEMQFDPAYQQLVVHSIDVVRGGKRSSRLDPARVRLLQRETQLERQMYEGRQTFSLVLDDVRVGDEIDIVYTLKGSNPVFGGRFVHTEWMTSPRGPVEQYRLRLLTPANRRVSLRPGNPDMNVSSRVVGAWQETIVRRESVRLFRPEESSSVQSALDVQFSASEFATWDDVAAWGRTLFAEPDEAMPAVDQKAGELRASNPTAAGRALAALEFVQKEVRYFGTELGTSSHRPASPEKVIQQRFGDCKDKVALLLALLRRMEIAGEPVLVSASLRSKVASALPTPLAFDHVIARVTVGDQTYWLDATRSHQTGPLAVRQALGFAHGLPLSEGATGLVAQPPISASLRLKVEDTYKVDQFAGPVTLESRMTLYGEFAEGLRDAVASGGLETAATQLSQSYSRSFSGIRSIQPPGVEEIADQNAIALLQRFSIPEFFRFPDQRMLVAEAVAWMPAESLRVPASENRRDALTIAMPGRYEHRLRIVAREDVVKAPAVQKRDTGDAFFSLRTEIASATREFSLASELTLKAEEIPAAEWSAHLTELRKAIPTLGLAVQIPTIPNDKLEKVTAELRALVDDIGKGRVKTRSKLQAEARVKLLLLGYQIDSGRLAPAFLAEALTERAIQYDHLGEFELAARDFERALGYVPDRKETINAAAVNAAALGRADRVLSLTDALLQRSPSDREALNIRMLTRYMERDFIAARRDLETLLQDNAQWQRGYPVIVWSLTQRYLRDASGPPGEAAHAAQLPSDWPRPLIEWLQDKIDADAVLRAARAGSGAPERLCEAYFYMGERYAAEGDVKRAAEHYRKALEQGITEFVEDNMARRRLAALEQH